MGEWKIAQVKNSSVSVSLCQVSWAHKLQRFGCRTQHIAEGLLISFQGCGVAMKQNDA